MPPPKPPPSFAVGPTAPRSLAVSSASASSLPSCSLAARSGVLTKTNTAKGTRGRQAVDRAKGYEPRVVRHPELTARQAAGHEAPGDVAPTLSLFTGDPPGPRLVVIEGASRRDTRRAGIYMQATRQLADDFRARPPGRGGDQALL